MNTKWKYLSYPLHPNAPAYGGNQAFFDEPDKQMSKGDSCNTRQWRMSNHMGTHIDFPKHFSNNGSVCDDYSADFWVFSSCAVLDIAAVNPGQIITVDYLELARLPDNIELLLLKTGFCNLRDNPVYFQKNPGLHPLIADSLRDKLPNLRVIGFDLISVSSYAYRELGRKAHRAFLDNDKPILLIEDMDLTTINGNTSIQQVIITPLRVKRADAAPCTVLVEVS